MIMQLCQTYRSYQLCRFILKNSHPSLTGSYAKSSNLQIQNRNFMLSVQLNEKKVKETQLLHQSYFINENKSSKTFLEAINIYKTRERHLRGHVEFILAALNHLEEYGVHRDITVYNELLNVFPKGTMIPRNVWQLEMFHYPKHQLCAYSVMEKMAYHGVIPNTETYYIVRNVFGEWNGPTKKLKRMLYWLPKFKFASPWVLPYVLPNDVLELSKLAIKRITSIDPATVISVFKTSSVKDAIDDTWIVSAISPSQRELLAQCKPDQSIKLEGPFGVYLQDQKVAYHILRGEPKPKDPPPTNEELDNISSLFVWVAEKKDTKFPLDLLKTRTAHEQNDGTILAVCATGTSSKDSLLSWVRILEQSNPALSKVPVLFTQFSPIGSIIPTTQSPSNEQEEKLNP